MTRKTTVGTLVVFGLAGILVAADAFAQGRGPIRVIGGQQSNFTDVDQDGVCDAKDSGRMNGAHRGRGAGGQCATENGCGGRRGRGFVDANEDGINDRSPLAQLELTDAQLEQIVVICASGPGPHRNEVAEILTEEQLAQLEQLCEQRGGRGLGRGFVDADGDGINDRSALAGLELTDAQREQIAAIRASGPGPHWNEVSAILTDDQLLQMEELRSERQANCQRGGTGGRGQGRGQGRGRGAGAGQGSCRLSSE